MAKQENSAAKKTNELLVSEMKTRVKTILGNVMQQTRNSFSNTLENLREKIKEARLKREAKSPKLFLTSSTLEFAKFQQDHNRPAAYPVISACIIALPYAFNGTGVFLGLATFIICAIMLEYSNILYIQSSLLADEACLQNIARNLFGAGGFVGLFFLSLFYSLSVIMVYNLVLLDAVTKLSTYVIKSFTYSFHRRIVLLIVSLFIIPVSLTNNARHITKLSLMTLISTSFLSVLLFVRMFTQKQLLAVNNNSNTANIFESIAIMIFVMTCQHSCRLFYVTIDQNDVCDTNKPANMSASFSLLCTSVCACSGALTFQVLAQGDVLDNLCPQDLFTHVCCCLYAVAVICAYPLECHNIRYLLQHAIVVSKKFRPIFNALLTVCALTPTFVIAIFYDCVATIVEISGFLFAIPLVLILPSALYLRLSPAPILTMKALPCLLSVVTGTVISFLGLIILLLRGHVCIHDARRFPYCSRKQLWSLEPSLNTSFQRAP